MSLASCGTFGPGTGVPGAEYSYVLIRHCGVRKCRIPGLHFGQEVSIWNKPNGRTSCLTFNRNSTVGDVAHKVMGDIPISYIEGIGGTRVSEDDIVEVGKHDVCVNLSTFHLLLLALMANQF